MASRISETQLILPVLFLLRKQKKNTLTTTQLIKKLEVLLKPSKEDLSILKNRKDSKFSQIVRNLISHHTLDNRLKMANYLSSKNSGSLKINHAGIGYLKRNKNIIDEVLKKEYGWLITKQILLEVSRAVNKKSRPFLYDEDTVISEGEVRKAFSRQVKRSNILRKYAANYFKKINGISCKICSFNFGVKYGSHGKGFIEIHHVRPIVSYKIKDQKLFLKDAIKNLKPVCANCHRIIHRNRKKIVSIEEMKKIIQKKR